MGKEIEESGSVEFPAPVGWEALVYAYNYRGENLPLWRGVYSWRFLAWAMARWMAWVWDVTTVGADEGIRWRVRPYIPDETAWYSTP